MLSEIGTCLYDIVQDNHVFSISGSPCPLYFAIRILDTQGTKECYIGKFIYRRLIDDWPYIFDYFYDRIRNAHEYNTRYADLYAPYGRLDMQKFSMKISGVNLWNTLPRFIKNATSLPLVQQKLKDYSIDKKLLSIFLWLIQKMTIYAYICVYICIYTYMCVNICAFA